MDVKKCDRCGGIYEEREPNIFESLARALAPHEPPLIDFIERMVDLCPNCSRSLKRWYKGKNEPAELEVGGTDDGKL